MADDADDGTPLPFPLLPATVDAFLDLVIPPEKLETDPLPRQMVSLPLLQRHHFLSITPADNLPSYLGATENADVDALTRLTPHHSDKWAVRYSGDKETLYAHVNTHRDLRFVFLFDQDSWKYHGLSPMPFPTNTVEILEDVWNPKASIIHVEAVDPDDAYWNSYGDDEGEDHGLHDAHTAKHPDTTHNSEDAYWAQYSSVHGTADSTIPSPMPERRRAPHIHESSHLHEDHLGGHAALSALRPNQHAIDLSDRLHALNERIESCPLPGDEEESLPELDGDESTDTESTAAQARDEVISTAAGPMSPEVDIALKEAIRGVYGLWKMGAGNGSADNGEFVELVKEAVHGL